MPDGAFRLRFFEFGDGRLALTSPFRRPARVRPASQTAKAFHPLPTGGGIALFEDACSFADGALMAANGDFVAETASPTSSRDSALRRDGDKFSARIRPLTWMQRLAGDFIYLRGSGDGDYARWLIKWLPRVAIAAQFCDLTRFRVLVSRPSNTMAAILRDSLGLFGIAPDHIEVLGSAPVFVQRLVLPLSAGPVSPESVEVLDSLPLRIAGRRDAPRRIFVADGAVNSAVGEVLRARGFAVIAPEKMSFVERIGVFSQAEIIVAAKATDLADAAFAPSGVKAIALGAADEDSGLIVALLALKKGRFVAAGGADPAALAAALDAAGG